jgi:branched-subunit amino acid aminotransferase/4-amino-4-deoxychorismate lyase
MIKAAKELLGEKYSASEMRKLMSAALQHGIDGFHADNDLKFDLRCLFLLTPGEPRHMTLPSGQLFLPDDLPKRPANACIVTHTGFMPPPREGPVAVVAAEGHREHAELKDSAWATQAHPLEALRQEGEEEVVMVYKGDCLEGLTSNFFAVTESGRVQTASGGVLDGTMRDLVLLAARAERIPVDEHAPRLEEAHTWQGCGISSTSRMFLPVHILRIDPKLAKRQLKHEHLPTRTHTHTHTRGEDGTISYLTAADPESVVGRLARRVKTMFPDECEPLKV